MENPGESWGRGHNGGNKKSSYIFVTPKRKWCILPKNTYAEDMEEFAQFSPRKQMVPLICKPQSLGPLNPHFHSTLEPEGREPSCE